MSSTLLEPEATTPVTTPSEVVDDQPSPYLWTPAQYRQMAEAGILAEGEKVELIEGVIVSKMTGSPAHDVTLHLILSKLQKGIPDPWIVRCQTAIITEDSEPEPDLAIVAGPQERYWERHPLAENVAMVIEVAHSSLAFDRRKSCLYARGGVPIYWIVNVAERQLEVFSEPDTANGVYLRQEMLTEEKLVQFSIAGETFGPLPVRDFLLPVRM